MRSLACLVLTVAVVYACTDGKDNVVTVADVNDPFPAALFIHMENVKAQTYDLNMSPQCHDGDSMLKLPGKLKLVSGDIRVSTAVDLASSGKGDLFLKKKSILIGTVCENGKSHNLLIPDKDCVVDLCATLGADLCHMLSTPGTYDLATLEKEANISSIVTLPSLSGAITGILKGEWQAGLSIVSNGKTVGNLKLPANENYIYIE